MRVEYRSANPIISPCLSLVSILPSTPNLLAEYRMHDSAQCAMLCSHRHAAQASENLQQMPIYRASTSSRPAGRSPGPAPKAQRFVLAVAHQQVEHAAKSVWQASSHTECLDLRTYAPFPNSSTHLPAFLHHSQLCLSDFQKSWLSSAHSQPPPPQPPQDASGNEPPTTQPSVTCQSTRGKFVSPRNNNFKRALTLSPA